MDGVRAAKLTAALFHLERRVWLLASALADLKLASGASLRSLQVRWIDQHERQPTPGLVRESVPGRPPPFVAVYWTRIGHAAPFGGVISH